LRREGDADDFHQLKGVGGGANAGADFVVKAEFFVFDLVGEVDVLDLGAEGLAEFGEFEVMGRDGAEGASLEEVGDHGEGGLSTFGGVGAVEHFIEEKEERRGGVALFEDALDAVEFGHKVGDALFEGIFEAHTGAKLDRKSVV
jgi:hypothetical protein